MGIAFFSSDYVALHPDKIQALQSHKDTPFVNDLFFDTLLGIIGIKDVLYVPQNDFSSAQYSHTTRDLSVLHSRKKLSKETAAS